MGILMNSWLQFIILAAIYEYTPIQGADPKLY